MVVLVLHNIRSAYNVGAIFRTAACLPVRQEAVGVSRIYLTGYTPAPVDRFSRPVWEVTKTALGAEKLIPWQICRSIGPLLQKFSNDGWEVVALEQSPQSIDYKKVRLQGPTAIILGNEVRGLSKSVLAKCSTIAEIPMGGRKESLNVSVAAGVFLFRLLDG